MTVMIKISAIKPTVVIMGDNTTPNNAIIVGINKAMKTKVIASNIYFFQGTITF